MKPNDIEELNERIITVLKCITTEFIFSKHFAVKREGINLNRISIGTDKRQKDSPKTSSPVGFFVCFFFDIMSLYNKILFLII